MFSSNGVKVGVVTQWQRHNAKCSLKSKTIGKWDDGAHMHRIEYWVKLKKCMWQTRGTTQTSGTVTTQNYAGKITIQRTKVEVKASAQ
jgi:hypothetical protein